jgi:hypothetical protein
MCRVLAASLDPKRFKLMVKYEANWFANLKASLVINPAIERPQLEIAPASLLDALWLSLAQELGSYKNVGSCLHCGCRRP